MRTITACLPCFFLASLIHAGTPKRVITIGGGLTEIVYALDAEHLIVGNDTTSYYPPAARKIPKVGYQRTLSAEGILSLEPDLVIMTDEAGPSTVLKQIGSAGIPLLKLKAGHSLDDVKANVSTIAKALHREKKAESLIRQINRESQELARMTANPSSHGKVLFILQHNGGASMVAGTETAADNMIRLSGAENVINDFKGYKWLTPEAAASLNPDVILITNRGLKQTGGKETLLKSPGVSLTSAARNGHVIAMDTLFLLGFGPRTAKAALRLNQAYQDL